MALNILTALSDPIVVLNHDGSVRCVNQALRELENAIEGEPFSRYLTDSFFARMQDGIRAVQSNQLWQQWLEVGGGERPAQRIQVSCSPLPLAGEQSVFVVVFGSAQTPLRLNDADSSVDDNELEHRVRRERQKPGEIALDRSGRILTINSVMLEHSGMSQNQCQQQRFWEMNCWPDQDDLKVGAQRCLASAFAGKSERMPARLNRPSGRRAWMELSFSPRFSDGGGVDRVLVEAIDVTTRVVTEIGRRQYTDRLVKLSRQLLRAQEQERSNVSMELHDDIGQSLTALRLSLHNVQNSLMDEAQVQRLNHCVEVVDQVLSKIRNISLLLRPPMLDDLGLVAALKWFVHRQVELTGLEIELDADLPGERWSRAQEVAVFRIVQEAISNAMRHSEATRINVSVRLNDDHLDIRVRDNGKGFAAGEVLESASDGHSLGLVGMQQRAALVNGEIHLESGAKTGTCVFARIPV